MNASNETIVAKIIVDNPKDIPIPKYRLFEFKDDELEKYKEDPGNFIIQIYSERDFLNFGELFLGLPNPTSLLDDIGMHLKDLRKD